MESNMKYFGIGLSRTGTTTLYSAFKRLGFKGVHYPQPKQLQVLDKYDFANDTPIPARFKRLDKKYPNSKFIYTTRDVDSWLTSCSEYFGSEKAKYIKPKYDFMSQYRLETYGVLDYDEDIFRMVYKEHDKNVRDYFKNRPDDLLIMSVSEGDGWEKLIPFIMKNDPFIKMPFPHTNKIVKFDQRKRQMFKKRFSRFKKEGNATTVFPTVQIPEAPDEIRLFSVVKNEMLKLPNFLNHYRELGVGQFFIVDNNSEDGTFEYLCDQADVHVFRTGESFYFEKDWITSLLEKYGKDRWCVLADADELFVYLDYENIPLKDYCANLDNNGYNAVDALLVDMYTEGPLLQAKYSPHAPPLDTFNMFDKDSYIVTENQKIQKTNSGAEVLRGGVHKRVFGRNYQLNKIPLLKYNSELRLMTGGHHYVDNAKLAPLRAAVLHFKLSSELLGKAETMKMDDEYHSYHYKKYYKVLRDVPDVSMKYEGSEIFTGSKQLMTLGLMK